MPNKRQPEGLRKGSGGGINGRRGAFLRSISLKPKGAVAVRVTDLAGAEVWVVKLV